MTLEIAIFRGRDGRWGYCPAPAIPLLAHHNGEFQTARDALIAARADASIPHGSRIRVRSEDVRAVRL